MDPCAHTKLCVLGYTRRSQVEGQFQPGSGGLYFLIVGYDLTPSFLGGGRSCGRRQVVPTTLSRRNIWKESPVSWELSRGAWKSRRGPCGHFGEGDASASDRRLSLGHVQVTV